MAFTPLFVQLGGALCNVLSINGTGGNQTLTCETSPHAPGKVTVAYSFLGGGIAIGIGDPTFDYELEVTDISHVFG